MDPSPAPKTRRGQSQNLSSGTLKKASSRLTELERRRGKEEAKKQQPHRPPQKPTHSGTAYLHPRPRQEESARQNQQEAADSRVQTLEAEKATLEESLRGEMLANEEQRNYIEILRQALETKVEELGLGEVLERSKQEKCDVLAQMVAMVKELEEKRKDVAQSQVLLNRITDM